MADTALNTNPDFFDAEVQARELEQQVMAAEDARKTTNVREKAKEVLEASMSIDTGDFKRMMSKYQEIIALNDEVKIKANIDQMEVADKKLLKKAIEFKILMEQASDNIKGTAAIEEIRLRNLERELFSDLESVEEGGNQPIKIEEQEEKESTA